jgi:hypothetical protein
LRASPVKVTIGDELRPSPALSSGTLPASPVKVTDELRAFPKIGIEIFPHDAGSDEATREALRTLRPAHLHLAISDNIDLVNWTGIGDLVEAAGSQLRLDIAIADDAALRNSLVALSAALRDENLVPESVAIFPSEQLFVDTARSAFPGALIGGGTPHFFVQLNRLERLGDVDFATFTTCPLVHGADDHSVMLSLQSLSSMIETLRARVPRLPIRVGPSGIAARQSPLGRQPESDGSRRIALAAIDPRTRGLFGAAWTLGYIASFAAANVDAITIMSLTGPSGIVEQAAGEALVKHPTYFLLAELFAPAQFCSVTVSEPSRLAALPLVRSDGGQVLLIANLSGVDIEVMISGWPTATHASIMDARSWEQYLTTPDRPDGPWDIRPSFSASCYRLSPYAIARLETSKRLT